MNRLDENTYKKMGWTFKEYVHWRRPLLVVERFLAEYREGGFGFLHGPFDNPAVKKTDMRTGVLVLEEWRWRSLHRDGAPARIKRDGQTGVIVSEEYFQKGRRHRTDGP